MAKKKGFIRGFFGSIFNIREGVGYDQIASYGNIIKDTAKDVFTRPKMPEKIESFDDLAKRLNLSDSEIEKRAKGFLYYMLVYIIISLCLFGYFIYLLAKTGSSILAILVSFALGFAMLANAFRESFWYMQMKKRKLGCSMKEWFDFVLNRRRG
jgi:intracellular multiplication protein IcmV